MGGILILTHEFIEKQFRIALAHMSELVLHSIVVYNKTERIFICNFNIYTNEYFVRKELGFHALNLSFS